MQIMYKINSCDNKLRELNRRDMYLLTTSFLNKLNEYANGDENKCSNNYLFLNQLKLKLTLIPHH